MKQRETVFVCSSCGNEFGKWSGQCSVCKEWNSLKEMTNDKFLMSKGERRKRGRAEVISLSSIDRKGKSGEVYVPTQITEFDRVLGKGMVRGQVILFAGEPGIGKSTLITQLMGKTGGLYVAGEESAEQIALRVERLGLDINKFEVLESNSIEELGGFLGRVTNVPNLVVVDSIQTMVTEGTAGTAGSVGQVREAAFQIIEMTKRLGMITVIVGQITKEGDIAGPKLLEHMVDTVLYFEGDKNNELRILRVTKNRFGPTDEVGIFKMTEKGLMEVRGEEINLVENGKEKIGSAVTIVSEGTRPVIVEIQALVTESFGPMPKRVFSGVDYNRGQLLVAVAQKVLGIPLYKYDVYVAVTGGIRVEDTGADLAMVAAMWSSYKEKSLGVRKVFVGEVSLLGEVKKVRFWEKRIKEAKVLGREVVEMRDVRELKKMV